MADIVWKDVTDQAPELANPKVAIDAQTVLLAWVNTTLKVSIWGGEDSAKYKLARVYLLAHVATLASTRGTLKAGPVISQSEGGVSQSYANLMTTVGTGAHSTTPYGQLYDLLLGTTGARLPFVPGADAFPDLWLGLGLPRGFVP